MSRILLVAAALAALALARLLPDSGLLALPRLAAATIVVLVPGALAAALVGRRSVSMTLVLCLAAVAAAWLVAFAFDGDVDTALVALAAFTILALAGSVVADERLGRPEPAAVAVGAAGVLFGLALWHVAGPIVGDGLFHLARTRKLLELDGLDLSSLNEFADGDVHAGYAFPLWHGFLALVARLAGVDPEVVSEHIPTVLAPVAFLVTFEAGVALFRTVWMGVVTLSAQVGQLALAAGYGGAYVSLAQPGTAARQLVVPATLALLFTHLRDPSAAVLAGVAAGAVAASLMHVTYAVFLAVPLGAFLVARLLWDRLEGRRLAGALAVYGVAVAAVVAWLLPTANATVSRTPDAEEKARALARYGAQLDLSGDAYRLAPEVVSRSGAVAVAALALAPLGALAVRRRWGALVAGGTLAVLVVVLLPPLFTALSDAVSLSQSRRIASFVPFAFAFAGGIAVLAGVLRVLLVPVAFAAGIVLQAAFPGDFSQRFLEGGGPAAATWWAAGGTIVLLVVAVTLRPRLDEHRGPLAAASAVAFLLPVAFAALDTWEPSPKRTGSPLTPGLVEVMRERVTPGAVVFSDQATSYRLAAAVPVRIAVAPPAHVADTDDNRPYERQRDAVRFFRTGDLAIPRSYDANWLLVDRRKTTPRVRAPRVYRDARYDLYLLGASLRSPA